MLVNGGTDRYEVEWDAEANDELPIMALSELHRARANCENVFDEIKNQWGWAGFVKLPNGCERA